MVKFSEKNQCQKIFARTSLSEKTYHLKRDNPRKIRSGGREVASLVLLKSAHELELMISFR